jgi:hypothetical protein
MRLEVEVRSMTDIKTAPEAPDVIDQRPASDEVVMSMLQEHVPLALLCDLGAPDGPHSAEILAEEGQPETPWWQQ